MIDIDKATLSQCADYYEENISENWCGVCKYKIDCDGEVRSGAGGEPIYPPCADGDIESYIDEDALVEEINDFMGAQVAKEECRASVEEMLKYIFREDGNK